MITINIGGQLRPFKFGFNAIDIFCRERKVSITQFGERIKEIAKGSATIGELRDIIYAGLAGGALSNNESIGFTCFQVGDWLDDLPEGELPRIMEAISHSVSASGKKKVQQKPGKKTNKT